MKLTNDEKNLLIKNLNEKFSSFDIITPEYIEKFVEAYNNGDNTYDGIDISVDSNSLETNFYLFVSYRIQAVLYRKLCVLANEDVDVLLSLVNDKKRVLKMVCRRFNFNNDEAAENYLMDAIASFDGSESFDSYITRYVIAQIKGVEFVPKSKVVVKPVQASEDETKGKKKKKKKKKNKGTSFITISKDSLKSKQPEETEPETAVVVVPKKDMEEQPVKEEITINENSPYQMCLVRSKEYVGSREKDEFVETFISMGTYDLLDFSNNVSFAMYVLLRFGFVNDLYYSLPSIASIIGIELKEVLSYERFVADVMKMHINKKIDYFAKLLLENN